VTRLGEFAQRVIVYFGQFFEKYQNSPHFWVTFPHSLVYYNIGRATLLTIFSQTRLVTLFGAKEFLFYCSNVPLETKNSYNRLDQIYVIRTNLINLRAYVNNRGIYIVSII
jgi:hypothetical protein